MCPIALKTGKRALSTAALSLLSAVLVPTLAYAKPCVILLHGLARTSDSMQDIAHTLSMAGFVSENVDYDSRHATIEVLAEQAISEGLTRCASNATGDINFVTHSLGGILVRQYLSGNEIDNLGRVVMLAPPNNGSEVVDNMLMMPGVEWYNGPSLEQLSVDEDSITKTLGKVDFDLGVIAGTRTVNYILSQFLPNPDDGKVSVESTKIEGMCGFLAVPASHTFIMKDDVVIEQVQHYLESGEFDHPAAEAFDCSR